MIKVYQKIFTAPGGDCFKAALASLLHLPLEAVPDFVNEGGPVDEWPSRLSKWLNARQLAFFMQDVSPERRTTWYPMTGYCLAGCRVDPPANKEHPEWFHMVVARAYEQDGWIKLEIVFDPNPNRNPSNTKYEFVDTLWIVQNIAEDPHIVELRNADFWSDVYFEGRPVTEDIKNELNDLRFLIDAVPLVYSHVTRGLISKPLTDPRHVIGIYEEEQSKDQSKIDLYEEAIRAHRDQKGDDRCWMDDEKLYGVLPEGYTPPARDSAVELDKCRKFIESRHNPSVEYVSPERKIEKLEQSLKQSQEYAGKLEIKIAKLQEERDRPRGLFE